MPASSAGVGLTKVEPGDTWNKRPPLRRSRPPLPSREAGDAPFRFASPGGITMSELISLSVSIALVGGIATVLLRMLGLVTWAAMLAWACYLQAGGDASALKKTVLGNAFGACCAWLAVMLSSVFPATGLAFHLRNVIIVGVTLLLLSMASRFKGLSLIPASLYGYAALFAYLPATSGYSPETLTHLGRTNGLIAVILSMVLGAFFGLTAGWLAGAMRKA